MGVREEGPLKPLEDVTRKGARRKERAKSFRTKRGRDYKILIIEAGYLRLESKRRVKYGNGF